MSFFGNDAINRVNLHSGIQALAQGAGGVFVLVFLLRAGVPTPLVFCTMAAMVAGRFLLRPAVLPLARRFGVKAIVIAGTVLEGAIFPLLPLVQELNWALGAIIVVSAIGSVLYWTSYHAFYAALGDAEHRGGQVGAREALTTAINVIAPALGGWALVTGGPWLAFLGAGAVQVLAAIPLIGAPPVPVQDEASGGFRAALMGGALMATDGWFAASFVYVWQIALFVSLGEGYAQYGGAMALAGLAAAVCSLTIGRLVDLGHGRASAIAAYGLCGAAIVLKAAAFGVAWLAVAANALGAVAASVLLPVLMARVYNLAKASPCPLRFHIATEAGWDLGCGAGCLTAAALTWGGLPLSAPILQALVGGLAAFLMLMRSYGPKAA